MVPKYNIPELAGFTLKPYVAFSTPKIPNEIKRKISLTPEDIVDIEKKFNLVGSDSLVQKEQKSGLK